MCRLTRTTDVSEKLPHDHGERPFTIFIARNRHYACEEETAPNKHVSDNTKRGRMFGDFVFFLLLLYVVQGLSENKLESDSVEI
jgi:hypothetical protein